MEAEARAGNEGVPPYVTSKDLERLTPYSRSFWQALRIKGEGPAFVKRGGKTARVLYRWQSVQEWLAQYERSDTGPPCATRQALAQQLTRNKRDQPDGGR